MQFETLAVHAGHRPDATTGAVSPPIHLSTTFERAEDGSFPGGFVYIRDANPNRRMPEERNRVVAEVRTFLSEVEEAVEQAGRVNGNSSPAL